VSAEIGVEIAWNERPNQTNLDQNVIEALSVFFSSATNSAICHLQSNVMTIFGMHTQSFCNFLCITSIAVNFYHFWYIAASSYINVGERIFASKSSTIDLQKVKSRQSAHSTKLPNRSF